MSEIQGKPVFGICECKEKRQVLSVEQTTDLIQQMASNDWQVPTDYIPKTSVNGIVEQHYGDELKVWVGTQAEYDALTDEEKTNCFALISDDPTYKEIQNLLNKYGREIENTKINVSNIIKGTTPVSVKNSDGTMGQLTTDENGVLKFGDVIIPQKKLLYARNGGSRVSSLSLSSFGIKNGDVLEVEIRDMDSTGAEGNPTIYKYVVGQGSSFPISRINQTIEEDGQVSFYITTTKVNLSTSEINLSNKKCYQIIGVLNDFSVQLGSNHTSNEFIEKIYKVIE